MRVYDMFEEMERILATPACWTQGTLARVPDGSGCHRSHHAATAYCLYAAMWRAIERLSSIQTAILVYADALMYLHEAITSCTGSFMPVPQFNDTPGRTFAEVRAVIALAKQQSRRSTTDLS